MGRGGLRGTRWWIHRFITGRRWRMRCAGSRFRISRCVIRVSICRIAGTIYERKLKTQNAKRKTRDAERQAVQGGFMIQVLLTRWRQGHRTMAYPKGAPPALPEHFRGRPVVDAGKCPQGCAECAKACPTEAITITDKVRVDLGRCLFCTDCSEACPQ